MQVKGLFYVSMLLVASHVHGDGAPAAVALPGDALDIVQRDSESNTDARVGAEQGADQEDASPSGVVLHHDEEQGRIEVHVRGEHFTTFHYGESARSPYLWPVHGEGGVGVTRNYPMGRDEPSIADHPHHRSLWLTYGDVNGFDFWHGRRGERVHVRRIETGNAEGYAWIRAINTWMGPEDAAQIDETLELRFHDTPASGRLIDFIVTFTAAHGAVRFGDNKEGMMAFRMRPEIDGARGGVLTNAHGAQGERNVYGKPSRWMDYSGPVRGHGQRGIALFDHPDNFRAGYWHVRNYGLAALNPFGRKSVGGGEDGSHTLAAGASLTLAYRVYVHSGDVQQADVAGHYARYAAATVAPATGEH